MDTDIKVSIICCAYNQEKYLEDALKGFINQKTDFGYEVLISDDASTDRTPEIIKKYAQEYPELIKPLFLKENHYSKGVYPGEFLMKKAVGKYFALCEGDDYWISENKLQKQYDALEAHPECDMCANCTLVIRPSDQKVIDKIAPMETDGIIPMERVILGGGTFLGTASLFFRREIVDNPREYLKNNGFDYAYQMAGAERGGIVYIHDAMSVYRKGTESSWTLIMAANKTRMIEHIDLMIKTLVLVNTETQYKFDKSVKQAIKKYEFLKASMRRDAKTVYSKEYLPFRKEMTAKKQLILALSCYAPWSLKLYQKLKYLKHKKTKSSWT